MKRMHNMTANYATDFFLSDPNNVADTCLVKKSPLVNINNAS